MSNKISSKTRIPQLLTFLALVALVLFLATMAQYESFDSVEALNPITVTFVGRGGDCFAAHASNDFYQGSNDLYCTLPGIGVEPDMRHVQGKESVVIVMVEPDKTNVRVDEPTCGQLGTCPDKGDDKDTPPAKDKDTKKDKDDGGNHYGDGNGKSGKDKPDNNSNDSKNKHDGDDTRAEFEDDKEKEKKEK